MKKFLARLSLLGLILGLGLIAVKIYADDPGMGKVAFYDGYTCTGEPVLILRAAYGYNDFRDFKMADGSNWNDRVSCLELGEGVKLVVYQKVNFGGKSKTFTRTASNPAGQYGLRGDWWDNSISSVKMNP